VVLKGGELVRRKGQLLVCPLLNRLYLLLELVDLEPILVDLLEVLLTLVPALDVLSLRLLLP